MYLLYHDQYVRMECIPNAPDYYVSSSGEIISGKYGRLHTLKPDVSKDGYCRVSLCVNGVRHRRLVHRIVAEVLIPNPHGKKCVNHIDGNKMNNSVSNLEWVTYKENEVHAVSNHLHRLPKIRDGCSKEVVLINNLTGESMSFVSIQKCADYIGCTVSNVKHALKYNGCIRQTYSVAYTGVKRLMNNNGDVLKEVIN